MIPGIVVRDFGEGIHLFGNAVEVRFRYFHRHQTQGATKTFGVVHRPKPTEQTLAE